VTADDATQDPTTRPPSPPSQAPPEVPIPPPDVPRVRVPPTDDEGTTGRSSYGMVLRLRNFRRLWIGMSVSSLGDWIGLFALLSMTNRLSPGNTLAVAGLMIFRVLPAFLVGPIAGVLLDRIDRRKAMIAADVARACMIALVPFSQNIPTLYTITFFLEVATLVWMPAKDALIPNLVPKRLLLATNSLSLFTTYGVFPLGALCFAALAGVAEFLGSHVAPLRSLGSSQESLALWIDTATFVASALIVSRVTVPQVPREHRPVRLGVLWDELVEGLRYLRERGEVARVMRSIAIALAGGAVVFSLGAPYSTDVLSGGPKAFGGIVASLGTGMGVGVLILGFIGDRLPKGWLASGAVIFAGLMLLGAGVTTQLALALVVAGLFGAGAGVAYASLFALLQELVHDEVRGRIFSSVQVVIRISLFVSLVVFPALAELYGRTIFGGDTGQGIRLALASGGFITCAAGLHGAWDVYRGRIAATSVSS
jgi:dTMP kinase